MVGNSVVVVDYDPGWPERFLRLGACLRAALGPLALRIDHIGATSVPGLAAKPVLDVQVSEAALEPVAAYLPALEAAGFCVRAAGSWSEQFALLMRDYLRASPKEAARYAARKRALAAGVGQDRQAYTDAKGPFIWALMVRADAWAQACGWAPGLSDA